MPTYTAAVGTTKSALYIDFVIPATAMFQVTHFAPCNVNCTITTTIFTVILHSFVVQCIHVATFQSSSPGVYPRWILLVGKWQHCY